MTHYACEDIYKLQDFLVLIIYSFIKNKTSICVTCHVVYWGLPANTHWGHEVYWQRNLNYIATKKLSLFNSTDFVLHMTRTHCAHKHFLPSYLEDWFAPSHCLFIMKPI